VVAARSSHDDETPARNSNLSVRRRTQAKDTLFNIGMSRRGVNHTPCRSGRPLGAHHCLPCSIVRVAAVNDTAHGIAVVYERDDASMARKTTVGAIRAGSDRCFWVRPRSSAVEPLPWLVHRRHLRLLT